MNLIEWRDDFTTGISDVDYEHKRLIELINHFYSVLEDKANKGKLITVLNDIYGEIYSHFMHEEALMQKHKYDAYQAHHDDHMNLLDDIRDITDELEATDEFDEQQLKEKLANWFSIHFKTHDARLHKLEALMASSKTSKNPVKGFFKKN